MNRLSIALGLSMLGIITPITSAAQKAPNVTPPSKPPKRKRHYAVRAAVRAGVKYRVADGEENRRERVFVRNRDRVVAICPLD